MVNWGRVNSGRGVNWGKGGGRWLNWGGDEIVVKKTVNCNKNLPSSFLPDCDEFKNRDQKV